MKNISFITVICVYLMGCFLLTGVTFGHDDIPTVTLPVSNLLEVRKDLIRDEGNVYPEGWSEYYFAYRGKTNHVLREKNAGAFDRVSVYPDILEMRWVMILDQQDRYAESDGWVEKEYSDAVDISSRYVHFDIYLSSDSLPRLDEEHLCFIFQDSTGSRTEGEIVSYFLDETIAPTYLAAVRVNVPLPDNPRNITWFSLQVFHTQFAGAASMRWEFRED